MFSFQKIKPQKSIERDGDIEMPEQVLVREVEKKVKMKKIILIINHFYIIETILKCGIFQKDNTKDNTK